MIQYSPTVAYANIFIWNGYVCNRVRTGVVKMPPTFQRSHRINDGLFNVRDTQYFISLLVILLSLESSAGNLLTTFGEANIESSPLSDTFHINNAY